MRLWLAILSCPLLAGCVGIGYPAISQTPPVAIPEDNVRAFRVVSEVTLTGPVMTGPVQFTGSVEEIRIGKAPISPQGDAYYAYYYLVFPFNGSRNRNLEVLFYRRGYETVSVPARPWWQLPGTNHPPEKVVWKEAPTLVAQKEAIERIDSGRGALVHSTEVLQFLAGEYAHLADSPLAASPERAAIRDELHARARECEELIKRPDQKPVGQVEMKNCNEREEGGTN